MGDMSDEIIELQTRVQFQDDVIHKLDAVVIRQAETIDRLTRRVNALEDRVEQLAYERDKPGVAVDEKPPHY